MCCHGFGNGAIVFKDLYEAISWHQVHDQNLNLALWNALKFTPCVLWRHCFGHNSWHPINPKFRLLNHHISWWVWYILVLIVFLKFTNIRKHGVFMGNVHGFYHTCQVQGHAYFLRNNRDGYYFIAYKYASLLTSIGDSTSRRLEKWDGPPGAPLHE